MCVCVCVCRDDNSCLTCGTLPGPIKNRVGFGFKNKTRTGSGSSLGFGKNLAWTRTRPDSVSLNIKLQKNLPIYISTLTLKLISLISLSTQPPLSPHPHWLRLSLSCSHSLTSHPPLTDSHSHLILTVTLIHSPTHPHLRGGAQISWWVPFVTEEHEIHRSERDEVVLLDRSTADGALVSLVVWVLHFFLVRFF